MEEFDEGLRLCRDIEELAVREYKKYRQLRPTDRGRELRAAIYLMSRSLTYHRGHLEWHFPLTRAKDITTMVKHIARTRRKREVIVIGGKWKVDGVLDLPLLLPNSGHLSVKISGKYRIIEPSDPVLHGDSGVDREIFFCLISAYLRRLIEQELGYSLL